MSERQRIDIWLFRARFMKTRAAATRLVSEGGVRIVHDGVPRRLEKPSVEVANLPDFRPETAAACNAVRLSVAVAADGSLGVNGAPIDLAGLKAAAAKKNAACQYVAAPVNLAVAPGVPDKRAEEIRDALAGVIKNLALIE